MQSSFSDLEYAAKKKQTRRDRFLSEIEAATPWGSLLKVIAPIIRLVVDAVIHRLVWNGYYACMLYSSASVFRMRAPRMPDATTLLEFHHLLEEHHLTESIFNAINAHLADRGLFLREGTIVDATLIAAPPSTKNKERKRDTEMHQTKKGNQWHFGMKVHIGIDAQSGLVHTLIGTAANVHDVIQAQA